MKRSDSLPVGVPTCRPEKITFWVALATCLLGLLWSAVIGSNLGLIVCSVQGHFVPELAIPFLGALCAMVPCAGQEVINALKSRFVLLVSSLIVALAFIGYLSTRDFVNAYADARATFTLFLTFSVLARRWMRDDVRRLLIIVMLVTSGVFDVIASKLRLDADVSGFVRSHFNIFVPYALFVVGVQRRSLLVGACALTLMAVMALEGFFRQYYVVLIATALIGISVAPVLLVQRPVDDSSVSVLNRRFAVGMLVLIIGVIAIAISSSSRIADYLGRSQSTLIHSTKRTEQLIDALAAKDMSVESERVNSLVVIFERPVDFLIPKGLGWRAMIDDVGASYGSYSLISTMDSAYFYIAYHYGLLVLPFFVWWIFLVFAKSVKYNVGLADRWVVLCSFGLIGLLLFVEAGMFTLVTRASSYGILFAVLLAPLVAVGRDWRPTMRGVARPRDLVPTADLRHGDTRKKQHVIRG